MPKKIKKRHLLDMSILIPYLILSVIGLIMVFSSTSYFSVTKGISSTSLVKNQLMFWILSLVIIGLMYKMKTKFLRNNALIIGMTILIFALLIIVLFVGEEINGARGWLKLGPVSLQPAEYLKIMIVWFLANLFSNRPYVPDKPWLSNMKRALLVPLGMILLVAIQPDLGNAAIILLLGVIMLLASGINWLYSLFLLGGGVLFSAGIIEFIIHFGQKILPEKYLYVYSRFAIFSNPFQDELDKGRQLINGYYAMFNGGLFGRGLGNSLQKKGFLSEAHTDYAFAITMEELGLIVSILILLLLFFLIIRIILVGARSKSPFNTLICYGMASLFLLQIFINLGGITGIIPLTGITFPFLSQGGNSLLVLSVAVAFALNISADEKRSRLEQEEN